MSKGASKKPDHCLNCDSSIESEAAYCPNCGQKILVDHLTFKYFYQEVLSNVFSLDSKVFVTFKYLSLKPAFLSLEFIQGRRISYVNPIQLFMITSFLYFLANSLMFLKEQSSTEDLVRFNNNNKNILTDSVNIQQQDSLYIIADGLELDTLENSFLANFLKKGNEFNALDKESQNEKVSRNISYSVFILMPIFALYLGFFFRRKGKKYLENIVFSLHFHSFFFFVGLFFIMLDKLFIGDIDSIILYLLVSFYLVVALKRFYAYSWSSSLVRFLGLIFLYGITVSTFLVVTVLISVLI